MKYWVMGYDDGRVVFMTQKVFDTYEEAHKYASSVGSGWKAFVVKEV